MHRLASTIQYQYYTNNKKVFALFTLHDNTFAGDICSEVDQILSMNLNVRLVNCKEADQFYFDNENNQSGVLREIDEGEIVLVDCGCVFSDSLPLIFYKFFEAGIIVVNAGETRRELVAEATELIERYDVEIIGTVLKGVKRVIPNFIYKMVF